MIMTYDEIPAFWTNENLVRWETTDVAGLAIPDEAKMFLCKTANAATINDVLTALAKIYDKYPLP
jgi:hypothetical protein